MKKAKGKAKRTAKKAEKKDTAKRKEPADFAEARKEITALVLRSATTIAARFIEGAEAGQLAPAKYLFEAVGLYPATEETSAGPEDSLAYTWLKRLGLPTEPLIGEEEAAPVLLGSAANPSRREPADTAEEDLKCDSERNPNAADGEEQCLERREDAVK
ncbi:MAG: hypothetical protein ACLP56_02535 [Candidatus Sulfotelmatobacter sp.]